MKFIPCLLIVGTLLAPAHAEPVLFEQSRVMLSLAEARELLALQAPPKPAAEIPPPVGATLQSVSFRVSYSPLQANGEIVVQSYRDGWQVLPLFGSNLPLESVEVGAASLVQRDGMICVMLNKAGTFPIKFTLALASDSRRVTLKCAPSLMSRLQISGVPPGRRLEFANGQRDFPAQGGEVAFELTEDRPVVPTRWALAGGGAAIREGNGELIYSVRFSLQGEAGSGLQATFSLPPGADELTVTGADLDGFRAVQTRESGRQLQVNWKTAEVRNREIQIAYRIPQNRMDMDWLMELPVLPGSEKVAIPFAAVPENQIELLENDGKKLTLETPLPRWLRPEAGRRFFSGEMAGVRPLKVRALPQLASETTAIRQVEAETRLMADGAMIGHFTLQLEHAEAVTWQFRLPQGSQLLNCEVRGRPANPIIREGGLLELEIPGGERSSTVWLSYTARQEKFDPLRGRLALTLPSTTLFIHKLSWKIVLPDLYEVEALEGNLAPQKTIVSTGTLQLEKQLIRGDVPQTEIFYVKNNPEK